jgi:hypothetical protein
MPLPQDLALKMTEVFLTENRIVLNLKPKVLTWKIDIVGIKNPRVFEENNNCRI